MIIFFDLFWVKRGRIYDKIKIKKQRKNDRCNKCVKEKLLSIRWYENKMKEKISMLIIFLIDQNN